MPFPRGTCSSGPCGRAATTFVCVCVFACSFIASCLGMRTIQEQRWQEVRHMRTSGSRTTVINGSRHQCRFERLRFRPNQFIFICKGIICIGFNIVCIGCCSAVATFFIRPRSPPAEGAYGHYVDDALMGGWCVQKLYFSMC